MRILCIAVLAAFLAGGCGREVGPPAAAPPPKPDSPEATPADTARRPEHVTTEQWLANPLFKDRNPYDLPLKYEIEVPELPPEGVMEPGPELPAGPG